MSDTTTVYISVGNSDDKLSQHDWSDYVGAFVDVVHEYAEQVYGEWYSATGAPFQNACMAAAIPASLVDELRKALTEIRADYRQDSVAWAEAPRTEFI